MQTSVLLAGLNALEESPWAGWFHGRGLNAQALSRLLRPFKIYPQNIRRGAHVVKGYSRQSFADAWERYL